MNRSGIGKMLATLFVLVLIAFPLLSGTALGQAKTLVVGDGAEPLDLMPTANSQPTTSRTFNIYENLVWLDENAQAAPRLAVKWETVENNKKWRFHLRKGVVFHNGEPFSAKDVAFTIDFTKDPNNKIARRNYIKDYTYKIIDDYTIDIFREDGKNVPPLFPKNIYCVQMLSKNTVSKMTLAELSRKPIGTGPFQFVEWKEGEHVTLKAFDKYWGGKPKLDRIIYKTIPEMATRVIALKTGDVDLITDIPAEEIKALEKDPNIKILKKDSLYNMHVTMRCDEPLLGDDINLRKAIVHALDVEAVCKNILGGYAIPLGQVSAPLVFGHNKDVKPYKYDPKLAKEYLKKSKYKGQEIAVQSSNGRYLKDIEINTAIVSWLKAVGINATLKVYDWPTWIAMEPARKNHPLCLRGWADNAGDGAENLTDAVHSKSPYSWGPPGGVPGVDALIDLANSSFDPKVRKEAIEKAHKLVYDYAYIAMYYAPMKVYGARKNVKWSPKADEFVTFSVESDKL